MQREYRLADLSGYKMKISEVMSHTVVCQTYSLVVQLTKATTNALMLVTSSEAAIQPSRSRVW